MKTASRSNLLGMIIETIFNSKGIIGLYEKNIDLTQDTKPKLLKENKYKEGIDLVKESKGYTLTLNVLVDSKVNVAISHKVLLNSLSEIFKQNKSTIIKLNLNIVGVKI